MYGGYGIHGDTVFTLTPAHRKQVTGFTDRYVAVKDYYHQWNTVVVFEDLAFLRKCLQYVFPNYRNCSKRDRK